MIEFKALDISRLGLGLDTDAIEKIAKYLNKEVKDIQMACSEEEEETDNEFEEFEEFEQSLSLNDYNDFKDLKYEIDIGYEEVYGILIEGEAAVRIYDYGRVIIFK